MAKHASQLRPALFFALLLLIAPLSTTWGQSDSTAGAPKPLGQLVDIGGWRLHLVGQGTNQAQGPTVILESGAGGFSFDWSLVQPRVATFARVYAYDRAGSAWSELGPRPHTMHQTVYELHTLLQRAGVTGPYVLVGASYGGILMRLFAQQYPAEVAGLVLVDSGLENSLKYVNGKPTRAADISPRPIPAVQKTATAEDRQLAQTPEARQFLDEVLAKSGIQLKRPTLNPAYQKLPESARQLRLWASSRYEYYAANDNHFEIDELALLLQYQKAHPQYLKAIPLIVLTKGPGNASDTDSAEQERKQAQAALTGLSSNSKQVIAHQSGHHIEVDDPDRVIEAIREVVEAVRHPRTLK
ncbi:alpha/beta hydrolase [Larkinella soli]|uniref:alpha/beta hydrolase n=1 Tax=Larkinella soli TaxID=1770527 RepID=UPI0013E2B0B3|nr:alpha/beta hydrolase [Larkinella soli]